MKNFLKRFLGNFIRKGRTFRRFSRQLAETEFYTEQQLAEYQNRMLRKMVRHCYRYVPYYRELFDRLSLGPEDIRTREDLKKLPFMDKRILADQFDNLQSRKFPGFFHIAAHTSGTSGIPGAVIRDYHSVNFENAVLWRNWAAAGDSGGKRVILRGEKVVDVERTEPPFWKLSADRKELVMSSYHLNKDTAAVYIDKILDYHPDVIYAYPSTVFLLAKYFRSLGKKLTLRCVFTSSEVLTKAVRHYIEETFHCRLYDWYGQTERVSAIGMCEKGTYHIQEDYSITELVESAEGLEIVGTSLQNYAMPLLRYRTGDFVDRKEEDCTCGRHFREVAGIRGRYVHYITLANGNRLPTVLLEYSLDLSTNILEAQLVQEKAGEILIRYTGNDRFSGEDRERLIRLVKDYTSEDMVVRLQKMKTIPRGPNGKFLYFVSHLDG